MSRKKAAEQRTIYPDVVYGSILVTRFINRLMLDGKKSVSEKIFYSGLEILQKKLADEAPKLLSDNADRMAWLSTTPGKDVGVELFYLAVSKVGPEIEVKSRRVGGATYQVPMEVADRRRRSLAIRWLITFSRKRSEKTMSEKLAGEFVDAIRGTGGAVKKKEDVFRMAESNKAFAHYKW